MNSLVLPLVELWPFEDLSPMLIVELPSGVTFTNQVAGVACLHPIVEGILLPLPVQPILADDPLLDWREHEPPTRSEIEARAGEIERWLKWDDLGTCLEPRIDAALSEAWIPVRVASQLGHPYDVLLGAFRGRSAIVTYGNSD